MNYRTSSLVAVVCAVTWSCGGVAPGMEDSLSAEAIDGVAGTKVVKEATQATEPGEVGEVGESVVAAREEEATARPVVTFVPAVNCSGMTGTWRSQVYSDMHTGYYDFTLSIKEATPGSALLQGSIVARSWGGSADDVSPPETCGEQFHWTVTEEASGQINEDGSVHFGGTSWKVGEHLCGTPVTSYFVDQFDADLPSRDGTIGSQLVGHISDSTVWVEPGMPAELTRTSCD